VAGFTAMSSAFPSSRKPTAIFTPRLFRAPRLLLYGRFLKRPSLVLAKTPGPRTFLRLKLGLSSMLRASKKQLRFSHQADIECLWRTRKNRGDKSSAVSFRRKDYWWVLPLLL